MPRILPADVPTLLEADVVVAGGGPAGVGAAVTAARQGARTVLIENHAFLGGNWTAAQVTEFKWSRGQNGGGLIGEVVERLVRIDGARTRMDGKGQNVKFAPEAMKFVLDQLAQEAGVQLLLHAPVCGAAVEDGRVVGAVAATKAGPQIIRGKVCLDSSGDGDLAAFAGAPFEKGDSEGRTSAPTLIFRLGNCDVERLLDNWPQLRDIDGDDVGHVKRRYLAGEPVRINEVAENMHRIARAKGIVFTPEQERLFYSPRHPDHFTTTPLNGVLIVNMAQVPDVDMTDPIQLSSAELSARRQIWAIVDFLVEHAPGLEHAYLLDTAAHIGVRETRRIVGDYVFTAEDLFGGRAFEDGVLDIPAAVDIHTPDGSGTYKRSAKGVSSSLPYRSLLPRGLEDILMAGRCVSATVGANIKGTVKCMQIGQVSGLAAALSVDAAVSPRALNVASLQAGVERIGLDLGPTKTLVAAS